MTEQISEKVGYFTLDRGETFQEGMITDYEKPNGRILRGVIIIRSSDGGLTFRSGETINLDINLPVIWEDCISQN